MDPFHVSRSSGYQNQTGNHNQQSSSPNFKKTYKNQQRNHQSNNQSSKNQQTFFQSDIPAPLRGYNVISWKKAAKAYLAQNNCLEAITHQDFEDKCIELTENTCANQN